jgi:HEAT repeat protein
MHALDGSQATSPDSRTKLLTLLKTSTESNVRVAALRVLIKALPKPAIEGHVGTLVDVLKNEASGMQDAAIDALEAFRPEATGPLLELLLPLLDSTDGSVRVVALRALRRPLETAMPQLPVSVRWVLLPRLLKCVENDVTERMALQVFEGEMRKHLTKEDLRVLLRMVEPLLTHESKDVCHRVGRLVSCLGRWAIMQVAAPSLAKLGGEKEMLRTFLAIIGACGAPTVEAHAPLLVKLCTHNVFFVRYQAIDALAKGPSPRQHASLFVEKLKDPDEDVRLHALLALQQVGTTTLVRTLRA